MSISKDLIEKLRVVVYRWLREVTEGSSVTVADLFESEKKEVKKPKISQSKSMELGTRSCRLFEHFHHGHRVTRLGHLFHHFLSLFELIQKLVNVGWSGAATLGYAAAPDTVQNLRAVNNGPVRTGGLARRTIKLPASAIPPKSRNTTE